MGKLVEAEITLKYSNGQLTIATTPNTIKGDGLLSYLDLAECAIIGANYKNLNEAMDIAAEHASAIIATVMHTAGNEKTSPKMGPSSTPRRFRHFICNASFRSRMRLHPKASSLPKRAICTSVSITPMATLGRKSFPTGSSFSFGLLAHLATTPTGRPSTSDILSIAPQTRRANKNAAQKPPDAHPAGQSREKGLSPWKA